MPELTPTAALFKESIKQKRRAMSSGNRARYKVPRQPEWIYPSAWERKYYGLIKYLQQQITKLFTADVRENLRGWLTEFNADYMPIGTPPIYPSNPVPCIISPSHFKLDTYPEDLRLTVKEIDAELQKIYVDNGEQTRLLISDVGTGVSDFNQGQMQKFAKGLLGYQFVSEELWEREVIEAWTETNFQLIKSLSEDYIKKVNTIVSEGVQFGKTYDEIMRQIVKTNKSTAGWQSMRIARDQVGKLNGQMTKRRQTDIGIETYIWSNVGDRRVRGNPSGAFPKAVPSHWNNAIGNKLCRWDDNSVYSDDKGKTWKKRTGTMPIAVPGQEILCRCTALPGFDDIIEEIDAELAKEEALKVA